MQSNGMEVHACGCTQCKTCKRHAWQLTDHYRYTVGSSSLAARWQDCHHGEHDEESVVFKQMGGFLSLLKIQSGSKDKFFIGPLSILLRILCENRRESPPTLCGTGSNIEAVSISKRYSFCPLLCWKRILLTSQAPLCPQYRSNWVQFIWSRYAQPSEHTSCSCEFWTTSCRKSKFGGCLGPGFVKLMHEYVGYFTNIWWSQEWK